MKLSQQSGQPVPRWPEYAQQEEDKDRGKKSVQDTGRERVCLNMCVGICEFINVFVALGRKQR